MKTLGRRALQALPVLLLVALTAVGLANAIQGDDTEVDLGPQATDFIDENGDVDIAGYLVAVAAFEAAPAVPAGEPLEFRVFGCTEGEPITIEFVPRGLLPDEQEANDALAEGDEGRLLEENVVLVEEAEALAEPAIYTIQTPDGAPLGFARLRVTCTGADGELVQDTVINLVDRAEFEALQEEVAAEEDGEPQELVTLLDGGAAG